MKILVTGAGGMLGSDLVEVLSEEYELHAFSQQELDIAQFSEVERVLEEIQPTVLINTAAYTKVDDCETQFELAHRVNGQAVGHLARACRARKILLVHFSTDYVFDGRKQAPYAESDVTNPLNVYGRSKLEGETEILKALKDFLLIRTSWLYGPHGPNFVDKILELASGAKSNPERGLRVVDDQVGSPTYTVDLAQAVRFLLKRGVRGILHVTNRGTCSWYEFAGEILERVGMDVPIQRVRSSEFPRPAKRPSYSILSNDRLEKECGYQMRPWQEALGEYLKIKG